MNWKYQAVLKSPSPSPRELAKLLLANRGLRKKSEVDDFLNPPSPNLTTPSQVGLDKKALGKTLDRLKKAIQTNEPIVVYGDYDADGICSTAILWETIKDLGGKVTSFIPLREKEGYGLSDEGIATILGESEYGVTKGNGLIIAVDSGIVAFDSVDYANSRGLDVLIIDHHEKGATLPNAHAILHTKSLCAAGISWFLAKELLPESSEALSSRLELAAIATITDLVPLLGPNRSIVKSGLPLLNQTNRLGLRALYSLSGIEKVGTYEVGFMIGPRLNASGRIENARTALNLFTATDFAEALKLAETLNSTNRDRQQMTQDLTRQALEHHRGNGGSKIGDRIIVLESETYHQGVIGLIAGKLVEEYYLPSIVISKGETLSKASARSISGFNIIEAIRETSDLLVGSGGHPMAAGFTIETSKISLFKEKISAIAAQKITPSMLDRTLRIDFVLPLEQVTLDLYSEIKKFEPFGLGNSEPTFATEVVVESARTVGSEGKHLKMLVRNDSKSQTQLANFDCIAFGKGALCPNLPPGQKIALAYTIDLNTFNGTTSLQLKVRDIKI